MFNKKQLIFIIIRHLFRAVIAALVALALILFLSRQIKKISDSINEQRVLAAVLEKRNENLSRLREEFFLIGNIEEKINSALPPADNILEFVVALEDLSAAGSLTQTFNFGSPVNSQIDYSISLGAGISALTDYLKGFEKLPYFTSVSGLNLSALAGDWQGNSLITLKAKLYTK